MALWTMLIYYFTMEVREMASADVLGTTGQILEAGGSTGLVVKGGMLAAGVTGGPPMWALLGAQVIGSALSAIFTKEPKSEAEKWREEQTEMWREVGRARRKADGGRVHAGAAKASELFTRIKERDLGGDLASRLRTQGATGGLDGI